MKTNLYLFVFTFFLTSCMSSSYKGFSDNEKHFEVKHGEESFLIELRFPWNDPIGIVYFFSRDSESNLIGSSIWLPIKRNKKRTKLDNEEALFIYDKISRFDWNKADNKPNPGEYNFCPDDLVIRFIHQRNNVTKELIAGTCGSDKALNFLVDIGFVTYTPNETESDFDYSDQDEMDNI